MAKKLPIVPSAKAGSMAEAPSGIIWREQHPVIGGNCNQCLECILFCPEGALKLEDKKVIVSLELCNGCGTCAFECPEKAITMAAEFSGDRGIFPLKEGKS
jgi:2-oxoacid:acceptor oxidoreductase delta subunit (pyruvate/2-ketoisovalerate family)